jgi:receptor-interacting serine/threonine-protein kinase 5
MPQLGREMGRGQYGVVYQCLKWAKYSFCNKVSCTTRWKALEWLGTWISLHKVRVYDVGLKLFLFKRQITDHERIVKLIGSVIDYSYGGGCSPAVLLIMEGMKQDLYTALKTGLAWLVRLQISLDVWKQWCLVVLLER